jgi:hypothetical protein
MNLPLKYERPRLIDLSSTEWETGAGVCYQGSSPNNDPNIINCVTGERANSVCNTGGTLP